MQADTGADVPVIGINTREKHDKPFLQDCGLVNGVDSEISAFRFFIIRIVYNGRTTNSLGLVP